MLVKVLPIRGTHMHVHDRIKYYPGAVKEVDDKVGKELVRLRIAKEIQATEKKEQPVAPSVPFKRGPGRPRKVKSE